MKLIRKKLNYKMFALDPPKNLLVVVVNIRTSEHQDESLVNCTGVCSLHVQKMHIERIKLHKTILR